MSTHEVKTWVFRCDQCFRLSRTFQRFRTPHTPPEDWHEVTRTREPDDRYAPTEYTVLLCPDCMRKEDGEG